jgi:hypothetical protein
MQFRHIEITITWQNRLQSGSGKDLHQIGGKDIKVPTYTVKNTKTNETYDVFCKYSELQELLKVDGVEQVLSTPLIVTGTGSLLSKTSDGWKDTLKEIKKSSARNNTIKV